MGKVRLDILLVEKGLVVSRSLAQRMVMAGQVRVNGEVVLKSSTQVGEEAQVSIEQAVRYVSRGGEKLEAALAAFGVSVAGVVCSDVGASTGGFTDCLLQHGARKVYAIDVGKGILHWNLRQKEDVVVMEATNARFVEQLPEIVDIVSIDASFISLKTLLPVVKNWLKRTGDIIALIKPQFEAGRREVARGDGVIRDAEVHRQVLEQVLEFARGIDLTPLGLMRSPLLGPKGNTEFLLWLKLAGQGIEPEGLVETAMIKLP